MLARLLPSGLFGAELWDTGQAIALHPGEAVHVAGAVEKRRREFAAGRSCARAALAQMGAGDAVIGRGADGAPLWPQGLVGSITHTQGYACAVVGAARNFATIGVDAEQVGGVGDDLLPRLFDPAECTRLVAMGSDERRVAATLGFSAREACFKAWGARFKDIHIEWDDGVFRAQSQKGAGSGRFAVQDGLVLTVIAVPV